MIGDAGPGAFLTYAITGVLIIMVMRMLGEMATANPSTGSFADYARQALGGWAGFSVGWLYWYFWVIVIGFEAVAGAKVLQYWIDAPLWLMSLILMTLMTAPTCSRCPRSASSSSGSPASRWPRSSSSWSWAPSSCSALWPEQSPWTSAT